mmetsp:Transcript_17690/g.62284  ORF Transcript_17690/g.62284 Transcript_17690/m.62284 type:complete len:292 (+) Transcript_17690:618-1493(+)
MEAPGAVRAHGLCRAIQVLADEARQRRLVAVTTLEVTFGNCVQLGARQAHRLGAKVAAHERATVVQTALVAVINVAHHAEVVRDVPVRVSCRRPAALRRVPLVLSRLGTGLRLFRACAHAITIIHSVKVLVRKLVRTNEQAAEQRLLKFLRLVLGQRAGDAHNWRSLHVALDRARHGGGGGSDGGAADNRRTITATSASRHRRSPADTNLALVTARNRSLAQSGNLRLGNLDIEAQAESRINDVVKHGAKSRANTVEVLGDDVHIAVLPEELAALSRRHPARRPGCHGRRD